MIQRNIILFVLFSILFLNDCVLSLKVYGIYVPPNRGMKTCMNCVYHLDTNETLNAVNWYRDSEPFFSFYASDTNPLKWVHKKFDDFLLDLPSSNQQTLCITNVFPSAADYYKCEVTTKGFNFEILHAEEFLDDLMPNIKKTPDCVCD